MLRENCVPGGIRTPNLLIRSQKLYPVELQALVKCEFSISHQYRQPSKAQRNATIAAQMRRGLDSVREYAVIIFRVGEIRDSGNQTQIFIEVQLPREIENTVGRNVCFRDRRATDISVLPELL